MAYTRRVYFLIGLFFSVLLFWMVSSFFSTIDWSAIHINIDKINPRAFHHAHGHYGDLIPLIKLLFRILSLKWLLEILLTWLLFPATLSWHRLKVLLGSSISSRRSTPRQNKMCFRSGVFVGMALLVAGEMGYAYFKSPQDFRGLTMPSKMKDSTQVSHGELTIDSFSFAPHSAGKPDFVSGGNTTGRGN